MPLSRATATKTTSKSSDAAAGGSKKSVPSTTQKKKVTVQVPSPPKQKGRVGEGVARPTKRKASQVDLSDGEEPRTRPAAKRPARIPVSEDNEDEDTDEEESEPRHKAKKRTAHHRNEELDSLDDQDEEDPLLRDDEEEEELDLEDFDLEDVEEPHQRTPPAPRAAVSVGRRAPSPARTTTQASPAHVQSTPRNPPVQPSNLDYTPWTEQRNPKDPSKPLWSLQSPDTRQMVELAADLYTNRMLATNPFADEATRVKISDEEIQHAAQILNLVNRIRRLDGDKNYRNCCRKMVKPRDSTRRSQIVAAARGLVGPHYGLNLLATADDVKARVESLLTRAAFSFKRIEWGGADNNSIVERGAGYQSALIKQLIFDDLFVAHGQPALSEHTRDLYKPIPLSVIACMAAAIECALGDWASGTQMKAAAHFSYDAWTPVYRRHLKDLSTLQVKQKAKMDELRLKIWQECWDRSTAAHQQNEDEDAGLQLTQDEIDSFDIE